MNRIKKNLRGAIPSNKLSFKLALFCACLSVTSNLSAQTNTSVENKDYVYKQKVSPTDMDNYLFSTYYYNEKKVYNLRNLIQSASSSPITSLKINPSGTSYAVLSKKGEKGQVCIYDLWKSKKLLHEFKDIKNPTAICYSHDAKQIAIAEGNSVLFFNARTYELIDKIETTFTPSSIMISPENYFLVTANSNQIHIWNMESKNIRKEFDLDVAINDIEFSDNGDTFAILTEDGLLTTYDTKMFFILQSYDAMGNAKSCHFHPEGKYVSVVTGDTRISVINLMDNTDRSYIDNEDGGISTSKFVKDGKKQIYLSYNTSNSITYKLMSTLAPFYTKLLAEELEERMNDWLKQMPGETLEEYKLRVNEETRAKQMLLFEQEIATRMADNLVQMSEVSLGNYNPESNMLAVNFNTMPTIYLEVPSNEITDFMEASNLEFQNAKYGLTATDKFELIYADVLNKVSGKTYTFNNLERRSLDFLKSDDSFVPLDLIQQSNMEELKLQEIKENIVNLAKQKNTISDHTNIAVNARIISDIDANGNKVMNYRINFSYEVEKGYSAQEDFGPGKYKAEQSGAAASMLSIIKEAFETEFAPYVKSGKKLIVKITGMADALPINGKIAYDGCYGDFVNEPVYKDNNLSNITITKAEGITLNEQLAFLRAEGVRNYISTNINGFSTMNTSYQHYIEVTEGKGGEYRRINVELTFVDAF